MATASVITEEKLREQHLFMQKVRSIVHLYQKRPLAYVHTYGCQQNVSDTERLKGMLEEMGYGFTDDSEQADIILLNTCAVRQNAEDKVFGNLGAFKHLKGYKSNLIIAVCGCMVQQSTAAEKMKKSYPFVDIIFGTHMISAFPEILFNVIMTNTKVFNIDNIQDSSFEGFPIKRDSKFKASVPIMSGCNNFCTYCVVPIVRGRERSRKSDNVIAEVKQLIADGYKEITLLGQNVNSYGKGTDISFPQLLKRLDSFDGEYKICFMTSHPKDCTRELIDVIAQSEHISRRLHLPVQSGSDRILKLMNRHYTRRHYLELISYAKDKINDLNLTTDIIVGFPGETHDDFSDTISLLKAVQFDSAFTFIYSHREGTKASMMNDPVSEEEKGIWFRELLKIQADCGKKSGENYVGKTIRVLCEGKGRTSDELYSGKTMNDIIVDFQGDESLIGNFVNIKIEKNLSWVLIGKYVD